MWHVCECGVCWAQGVDARSPYNLGHLLLSFLDLFGNTFMYQAKAVSVRGVGPCLVSIVWLVTGRPAL